MRRRFQGEDILPAIGEAMGQNDRAAAIVLAALLEDVLRSAVALRLPGLSEEEAKPLFEDRGVLYTFDARIRMGRALAVYGSKTEKALDQVRRIRNVFAHVGHPVSFRSPEVKAACALIDVERHPAIKAVEVQDDQKTKRDFINSVASLFVWITDHNTHRLLLNRGFTEESLERARPEFGDELIDAALALLRKPPTLP